MVGSGSLPPGLPVDTYVQLCRIARELGARVIVDAARDALAAALAGEPDLVTPNLAEAEGMSSGVLVEDSDRSPTGPRSGERACAAARALRAAGARRAVVTAGAHGVAYADDDGERWWDAPAVAVINPIGAGDAFVGGVADQLLAGADWPDAVRRGVLVASAAVEHPQAGRVDPGRVSALVAALDGRRATWHEAAHPERRRRRGRGQRQVGVAGGQRRVEHQPRAAPPGRGGGGEARLRAEHAGPDR